VTIAPYRPNNVATMIQQSLCRAYRP